MFQHVIYINVSASNKRKRLKDIEDVLVVVDVVVLVVVVVIFLLLSFRVSWP